MFKIRKFEPSDADYLCPRAIEKNISEWKQCAIEKAQQGPAFTWMLKDCPIMSAGLILMNDNSAYGWALISKESRKHKRESYQTIKTMMKILIDKFDIKKLIADCAGDFPEGESLLRHLGFLKTDKIIDGRYIYEMK